MLMYFDKLVPGQLTVGKCIESHGRKMIAHLAAPPGLDGLDKGA